MLSLDLLPLGSPSSTNAMTTSLPIPLSSPMCGSRWGHTGSCWMRCSCGEDYCWPARRRVELGYALVYSFSSLYLGQDIGSFNRYRRLMCLPKYPCIRSLFKCLQDLVT
jgi:hypothetical protein